MPSSSPLRLIGVFLLLSLLPGCSSKPDQPEAELARKNRASEYTAFGNTNFQEANYPMALRYFELALSENIAVDNLIGIAKSYNSIGRVYAATGIPDEAAENYRMAMEFALLAKDDEQIVQTYVNQGDLHMRVGDSKSAREALEAARAHVEETGMEPNAVLYHNLGTLYARDGNYDSAVGLIETARLQNERDGNWSELGGNYFMLASIASRRNNYIEARELAVKALEFDKRGEHSPGIATDLKALGVISERLESYEEAYQYYLRSLRVYLALNDAGESAAVLERLSVIADSLGKSEEAERFRGERERILTLMEQNIAGETE